MELSSYQDWVGFIVMMLLLGYVVGYVPLKIKEKREEEKARLARLNQPVCLDSEPEAEEIEEFNAQPEKP